MSNLKILPDNDGLYRCDLCGYCYNRDEVSEKKEVVNLSGRAITIFHHICDGCNTAECTTDGKTKEKDEPL